MSISAQNRPLPDWFTKIRTRQTVLPRFQRFEAWSHSNITQMFNTILQKLPIGAVLILEIGNKEPFISRPIVGAPTDGEKINEHLLDGQQRITGLWRGLHNNYEDRTYFVYLKEDEETRMPYFIDSISRWKQVGDAEIRPFWANKPEKQWERKMIPLDLCAPGDDAYDRYKIWAQEALSGPEEREEISEIRSKIRDHFTSFNLPYLTLPVTTSKETALDVFIKMNTTAAPLRIYDIVVAQVEASLGKSLHDLIAASKEACPTIAEYYAPEDLVLYASALFQGKAPTNKTYLDKEFGKNLLDHWDELIHGIKQTTAFLEEERVFDSQRLPTDLIVPVLTALWARAPKGKDDEGRARNILRKYLWRAFFSNRYEKSTSSRTLADFTALEALINRKSGASPLVFNLELHPLPEQSELVTAGWPKKKERLARAILALALKEGGHDLADGSSVNRANLAKREYHHLFPDAYLKRAGFGDKEIYRALNCAVITWQTNRNISDKEPEKYLAERLDGTDLTKNQLRNRLETHLIPLNEMVKGNYESFLEVRAELIWKKMNELCMIENNL